MQLSERDLAEAAEKAVRGDRTGAIGAIAATTATAFTGSTLFGTFAKLAAEATSRLVLDNATDRFLRAGVEFEEERARTRAYQSALLEAAKPILGALEKQGTDQFRHLCTLLQPYASQQEALARALEEVIHRIPQHSAGPAEPSPSAPSRELQAVPWGDGPLTLTPVLDPPRDGYMPAYPTGRAGAHYVFDLHNTNRDFDFSVKHVAIFVLEYALVTIRGLQHGVGATAVSRTFCGELRPRHGIERAAYRSSVPGEFVKVLCRGSDRFDVEITTGTEGLYRFRLHAVGSMAGKHCEVSLGEEHAIVFFRKDADYPVDWSPETMPYGQYIVKLSAGDASLFGPYAPDS